MSEEVTKEEETTTETTTMENGAEAAGEGVTKQITTEASSSENAGAATNNDRKNDLETIHDVKETNKSNEATEAPNKSEVTTNAKQDEEETEDRVNDADETTKYKNTPEEVVEEEVVAGDWKARKVEVQEIKVETGEEAEEIFWQQRSKLYRWAYDIDGTGLWKERGLGESKLLKHTETGKIRFLLRQEKTLKVVANHYVLEIDGLCKLCPNVGSDKIWVWTANNHCDDEHKIEQMALKFATVDQAKLFKEKFQEAASINKDLFKKD